MMPWNSWTVSLRLPPLEVTRNGDCWWSITLYLVCEYDWFGMLKTNKSSATARVGDLGAS